MAEIIYDQVSKIFDDGTHAVNRLSLHVRDGEFMVLVGPSGCGKTTALRMLAGLENVTEGTITIGNQVVNDIEAGERDLAMVFQNYALYPHLSVYNNIAFSLLMQKRPKPEIRERVNRTAEVLGLTSQLNKKPGALSGGQRQRVAMGRAIVREPRAFLMDEPLSNLDAKLRTRMRFEVARLQRELKATTIYVTHDQIEAMTMGDRVAVLRGGVLQQLDRPQHVYEAPCNLFVASFIGSPPMNIVEARLEKSEGGDLVCALGEQTIELSPGVCRQDANLQEYVGRSIALGMRPEHLEDAAIDRAGTAVLRGSVVLAEPQGAEIVVHVAMPVKPVMIDDALEVENDDYGTTGEGLASYASQNQSIIVGRFDSGSSVKSGCMIDVAVDVTKLHFFDIESGAAI